MKIAICLFASLLIAFVGVSMANEELAEDNELAHKLVKRRSVIPCGFNGANCKNSPCCPGNTCVYGICKSCNSRKCKTTRDCCNDSSCIYGNCKSCNPRKCKNTRDCCDDSSCVYGNCTSCTARTCKGSNDCCKGYNCSYKKCVRSTKKD
ncbi:keratin-associated protein 5-8-like [Mytilus trossulus]|uniref:keratin-associated protein 5-8-like n=1 Tax=Mytilus trossulus TaxID=6551 RepID=UPI003003B1C2